MAYPGDTLLSMVAPSDSSNFKKTKVTHKPNLALDTLPPPTPRMPLVPPPPPVRPQREGRNGHPGLVDKKRAKRTPAQKKRDDEEKAAVKQGAAQKKQSGIEKAAMIEDRLEAEDMANDRDGNNPPPTNVKKVLRPRPAKSDTAEQDPGKFSAPFSTILTLSVS